VTFLDLLPDGLEIGLICACLICPGKTWRGQSCGGSSGTGKKGSAIHGEEGTANSNRLSTPRRQGIAGGNLSAIGEEKINNLREIRARLH
jgi:hypothetical protein